MMVSVSRPVFTRNVAGCAIGIFKKSKQGSCQQQIRHVAMGQYGLTPFYLVRYNKKENIKQAVTGC